MIRCVSVLILYPMKSSAEGRTQWQSDIEVRDTVWFTSSPGPDSLFMSKLQGKQQPEGRGHTCQAETSKLGKDN